MSNSVIESIKKRRSIRKFTNDPVEKESIDQIIQAGRYAPSAKDDQPWRFVVITNQDRISKLSTEIKEEIKRIMKQRFLLKVFYKQLRKRETLMFLYGAAMAEKDVIFFDAPVVILIVTEDKQFYDESCACCAQNMMLAAHALDIGSCWIGFASFLNRNRKILDELKIPQGYHIAAALIFGHPKTKPRQASIRKPLADVINWIE